MASFKPLFTTLFGLLLLSSCLVHTGPVTSLANTSSAGVQRDTLTWNDSARNRKVPVAVYGPASEAPIPHQKLVIFSHGYYQNKPDGYLRYSYLTEKLASQGYLVVSVQHELPTDSLIPASGTPQVVRRPFWDRGADNIRFVLQRLQQTRPSLDFQHVALIGHSNGGDMVALFAHKYPGLAAKIITLDNRRMALPRTKQPPRVYSLRSSDQAADAGVLPAPEEQKRWRMTVISLPHTIHNDMDNQATPAQRQEITQYVLGFLQQ